MRFGSTARLSDMCRSIKRLRTGDELVGDDEIRAAALQFVRKVSGFRDPSRANEAAFEAAVEEIAGTSKRLLETLTAKRSARPA